MAESAVTFLLGKLSPLLENELRQLTEGREEVIYVRAELENITTFLKFADSLEESDVEVKSWVKQIRDVSHDTEDILDEFKILLAHDHGSGVFGYLHKMSCCIKNVKASYRIAPQIKAIYFRMKNISDRLNRIHEKVSAAKQISSSSRGAGSTWQDCRGDAFLLDGADLVGIEGPKKQLVDWLVEGNSGREVISLVGMGGLGKTTLANQVYQEVKNHFDKHAWITVSPSYNMEELFKDIVQQLLIKADDRTVPPAPSGLIADSTNSRLVKTIIKNLLQEKSYLVVLDDLWHLSEWDAFKYALPNNNCGSRVMLTTRDTDLALTTRLDSNGKLYNLEPLTPDDSWALFCKKTFCKDSCPSPLKEICRKVLAKCEGLPKAIVAISSILATRNEERIDEWENIRIGLGDEIESNDKLMKLKNVAEGFVEAKCGRELEDVAEDYFNELLNKNLLQVTERTSDGRVKTCHLHELLREIIIFKSRNQNLAIIANEKTALLQGKIRRLSIHREENQQQQLEHARLDWCSSWLRSLFIFGGVIRNSSLNSLFPSGFRLLRVMDLQGSPLTKFPIQVLNLYYLKYLSLKESKVSSIPSYVGKLKHLETLDLKHTQVTELPVEILKLQRLRHLLVYHYDQFELDSSASKSTKGFKAPVKIGDLRSLQQLCYIKANQVINGSSIVTELGKLTQLRRLGVENLRKQDGRSLCSSIENLRNLRTLSLLSEQEEDELLDLHHHFSPPPLLQRLYLAGRLEMLPLWVRKLEGLVIMHLKWSRLLKDHDAIESLQVLPNLVHLELCEVYGGDTDTLCFKADGFIKLRILGIRFEKLRCVKIEEGALPCVEKLSIQRCMNLEKVSLGFEYLKELIVLEFIDMPQKLIKKLSSDEQRGDYWRVAHIPKVYSTSWIDGKWKRSVLNRISLVFLAEHS